MKFKIPFFTALGVMALSAAATSAEAGPMLAEEAMITPAPSTMGGNISVGYDSSYIFRGVNYGKNSIWGSVEASLPFTPEGVDFTVSAWYQNPVDSVAANPLNEDELDLYATLTVEVAPDASVWLGYAAFLYPEAGGGNTNEVGLGTDVAIGGGLVDFSFGSYYDFDINGWFFETGMAHTEQITDMFGVEIGTSIGYQVDYNSFGSDWNDVRAYLAVPITLVENVALTPYVAYSWSLSAIDAFQGDELYGGVALSVSF